MKKTIVTLLVTILVIGGVFSLCACNVDDPKTITIGASPTPHAKILQFVKAELESQGYSVRIQEFNDYILPNEAVESGDLLANYFQHKPYLNEYNANNGTHLVSVADVHYEPFAAYATENIKSVDDLKSLSSNRTVKIAIPNDGSNEARALKLLESCGLITLKNNVGFSATLLDIEKYNYNLQIIDVNAELLPTTLKGGDVDLAVINGNFAIGAGLDVSKAISIESADTEAATVYANVICVKAGNENDPRVIALVNALKSKAVREYVERTFSGGVVPLAD